MEDDEGDDLYADTFDGIAPWIEDGEDDGGSASDKEEGAAGRASNSLATKGAQSSRGKKAAAAAPLPAKVLVACVYCRHRRIRCDGLVPCTSCAQRNRECEYPTEPPKKRGPKGKPKSDFHGSPHTSHSRSQQPTHHMGSAPRSAPRGGLAAIRSSRSVRRPAGRMEGEYGEESDEPQQTPAPSPAPEARQTRMESTENTKWYAPMPQGTSSESASYEAQPMYARPMNQPQPPPMRPMVPPVPPHIMAGSGGMQFQDPSLYSVPMSLPASYLADHLHMPQMGPPGAYRVNRTPGGPQAAQIPAQTVFPIPSDRDLRAIESFFVNLNGSVQCVDEEAFNHNITEWVRGRSAAALHPAMPRYWWCAHSGIEPQLSTVKPPDYDSMVGGIFGGGIEHYARLTNIDRAQLAQYFAVLAIGYRLLRGPDGKPSAENPVLADGHYERARSLAYSTIDDPCYPLISALLCMSHYCVGHGRMIMATIQVSTAYRLARACGLTVDDGALGSACRFFRQVLCTDLEPLPITPRTLPPIGRLGAAGGREGSSGSKSETPDDVSPPAESSSMGPPPAAMARVSSTSSAMSDSVSHRSSPPSETEGNAIRWTWREGPPANASAASFAAESNVQSAWTMPLAATMAGTSVFQGDADSRAHSDDAAARLKASAPQKKLLSWAGTLLDTGTKPIMSLGSLLGGRAGTKGMLSKEHLDSSWGYIRFHGRDQNHVVLTSGKDGAEHPVTVTAYYLDMRAQELLGCALSRMTNIRRGVATKASKREVRAIVDELYDITQIPGVEMGPCRLATVLGLKAITARQAGQPAEAEEYASRAVDLWGSVKLSQTSHSFLMSFVARHVALIALSLELTQAITEIRASRNAGANNPGGLGGPPHGKLSSKHSSSASMSGDSEHSSAASLDRHTRHERSSRHRGTDTPQLPPLSEYRQFYTLATMIGCVANHWPICARMYSGMMTEAAAMYTAAAEKLAQILGVSPSMVYAAEGPSKMHAVASMNEFLDDMRHVPSSLKSISGVLPDVPSASAGIAVENLPANQPPSQLTRQQHQMTINLLSADDEDSPDTEHEGRTRGHSSGGTKSRSYNNLQTAGGDADPASAQDLNSMLSPLDLLCQVLNHEEPLPVPEPSPKAPAAPAAPQPVARPTRSDSLIDNDASDVSLASLDGSAPSDNEDGRQEFPAPNKAWAKGEVTFSRGVRSDVAPAEAIPAPPPALRGVSAASYMSSNSNIPQSANELHNARIAAATRISAGRVAGTPGMDMFGVNRGVSVGERALSFSGVDLDAAASPSIEMAFGRGTLDDRGSSFPESLPPNAIHAFLGTNSRQADPSPAPMSAPLVAGVKRPQPSPPSRMAPKAGEANYQLYGPASRLNSVVGSHNSPQVKRPRVGSAITPYMLGAQGPSGPLWAAEYERRGSIGSMSELAPPTPHRMPDGMVSLTPTTMAAGVPGLRLGPQTPGIFEALGRQQSDFATSREVSQFSELRDQNPSQAPHS